MQTLLQKLIAFLLLFSCAVPGMLHAQDARLVLDERFVLGTSENDPNRMFGDPILVGEDGAGRIYVFDHLAMCIKIYDRHGRFVGTLGERGRKPGAFNNFSTGWVTQKGQVLVFDQFNRRLTRLSRSGEVIDTTTLDPEIILWPREVIPYGANYLLLYRHPDLPFLVHEWNSTFTTQLSAFVEVDDFTRDDPFLSHLPFTGHAALWNGRLVVAPPICDGSLLQYDSDTGRLLAEQLRGVPFRSPPFETVSTGGSELPDEVVVLYGPEGRRAARVYCWSIGLVSLPGGYLAHFSARQEESKKIIFVELFDRNGTLVGVHAIDALAAPGDQARYVPILVFPGIESRLFVVDRRGSYPLVRVFEADVRTP